MYRIALFVMAGWVTLVAGCRTNANQQLLERELRLQEDMIYHLKDVIEEYEQRVASCRRENSALRESQDNGQHDPVIRPTPEDDQPPGDFKPPRIDLGPETIPSGFPKRASNPDLSPSDHSVAEADTEKSDEKVHQIVINPRLTGGNDADGRPGDEGLMVVFEPRDAENRPLNRPGLVSLIVEDPMAATPHVARWNFAADEVASRFRNSLLGRGFQFELPWPNQPPANKKLRLRVIYRLASGRSFSAEHRFEVDLMTNAGRRERTNDLPPPDVSAEDGAKAATSPSVASQRRGEDEAKAAHQAKPAPEMTKADKSPTAVEASNQSSEARSARRPRWSPIRN